jgi:hypothetical protein
MLTMVSPDAQMMERNSINFFMSVGRRQNDRVTVE